MINLGLREARDLYRRVQQDQFFKLNLQRIEIPLSFLREAIDRKSEDALFVWIQVLYAHARDALEPQLLRRLVAHFTVNELIVACMNAGANMLDVSHDKLGAGLRTLKDEHATEIANLMTALVDAQISIARLEGAAGERARVRSYGLDRQSSRKPSRLCGGLGAG
jgi:hypothetical protein